MFIISEDSSKNSFDILVNIITKILRAIQPNIDCQFITFDNYLNKDSAMKGSKWKSEKGMKFRNFMFKVMNELKKDNSFVFWHIDGDAPWSGRDDSENISLFHKKIKKIPHTEIINGRKKSIDFSKLFLIAPFYSIESWLYPFLKSISIKKADTFKFKDVDISEYDEIIKIKDESGIADTYNLDLSKKFKHKTVYDCKKSYFETFEHIKKHNEMCRTLQSVCYQ